MTRKDHPRLEVVKLFIRSILLRLAGKCEAPYQSYWSRRALAAEAALEAEKALLDELTQDLAEDMYHGN